MDLTVVIYLLLAIILLAASFFKDQQKTRLALKASVKTFSSLFPLLLFVFVLMGLSQAYVSRDTIAAAKWGPKWGKGQVGSAKWGQVLNLAKHKPSGVSKWGQVLNLAKHKIKDFKDWMISK